MSNKDLSENIKLLLLDVDGVLTDGRIIIGEDGELCKNFHVADGLGISLAKRYGIEVGIITGRSSRIIHNRAKELGITLLYTGIANKAEALAEILLNTSYTKEQIAYMGDDLNDLAVMQNVGFCGAPANAIVEVKERAHFICTRLGGYGAVREFIEYLLKNQGHWGKIVQEYLRQGQGDGQ